MILATDNSNKALLQYIENCCDAEPEHLYRLFRRVHTRLLYPRMCSGHLQGRILKMLTQMINPRRVLELGTYAGYSALCLAEGLMRTDAMVDTLEADDEMEDFIKEALADAPHEVASRVALHIGDALSMLPTLLEAHGWEYDLVFIDADKRQYVDYYETILPALPHGAYILADNTLWDGKVTDQSAHDIKTESIRRFNNLVATDSRVTRVMLPLRDGLTIIRKL